MKNDLPGLAYNDWKDTYATLHMWTQVVGKLRLVRSPWVNHSWHTPLYVTARLTTSPIPYNDRSFEVDFDLIDHQLLIRSSDGRDLTMECCGRARSPIFITS